MIADKGCAERGCPLYDDRLGEVGVEMVRREWVGLTQEDIDIAFDDTQEGGGFDDFARAIEATLKRKNT